MAQDYEITSIRTASRVTARGDIEDIYEIYFTTKHGDSSFVRVAATLPKDEIQRLVDEAAQKLIAIREL